MQALRGLGNFLARSELGPLYFVLIFALRPLIFFSATLLCVAGGALYGPWWGGLYTVFGANLGVSVAYGVGYLLAREVKDEGKGAYGLGKYVRKLRAQPFFTMLNLRLMFFPYDLLNYGAGYLKLRFLPFLLGTVLGSLPGMISVVLFGASSGFSKELPELDPRLLAVSVGMLIISFLVSRIVKKRQEQEASEGTGDETASA